MAGRLPLKQIVSSLHPLKQKSPIDSTDEGMVTEVKLPQSLKQYLFNEITDEGIVIEVKLLQPQYMYIFEYQLFVVNTIEKWLGFCLNTENWVIFN